MSSIVSRRPPPLGVGQPREGLALDINEVGDFKDLVQTREAPARPGGVSGCQDGDSSGGREGGKISALDGSYSYSHGARPAKIAHGIGALCRTVSSHGPRPRRPRMWRGAVRFGRLRLLADRGSVRGNRCLGKFGGRKSESGGAPWLASGAGEPSLAWSRGGGGGTRAVGAVAVARGPSGRRPARAPRSFGLPDHTR